MRVGRVIMIVVGAMLALIGLGAVLGAGTGLVGYAVGRSDDGFFRTDDIRLASPTHAVVSEEIDLDTDAGPADWLIERGALGRREARGGLFRVAACHADQTEQTSADSSDLLVSYGDASTGYSLDQDSHERIVRCWHSRQVSAEETDSVFDRRVSWPYHTGPRRKWHSQLESASQHIHGCKEGS